MFADYFIEIGILFGVAITGLWWWKSLESAQLALAAVERHCKQLDLQLLDYCVAVSRARWKKDDRKNWRLWRYYEFEFSSTGDERYQGCVVIVGKRVQQMHLEPHRIVVDSAGLPDIDIVKNQNR